MSLLTTAMAVIWYPDGQESTAYGPIRLIPTRV
jgi:hypothetical protein